MPVLSHYHPSSSPRNCSMSWNVFMNEGRTTQSGSERPYCHNRDFQDDPERPSKRPCLSPHKSSADRVENTSNLDMSISWNAEAMHVRDNFRDITAHDLQDTEEVVPPWLGDGFVQPAPDTAEVWPLDPFEFPQDILPNAPLHNGYTDKKPLHSGETNGPGIMDVQYDCCFGVVGIPFVCESQSTDRPRLPRLLPHQFRSSRILE